MTIDKHKFEYKYLLKKFGPTFLVSQWLRKYMDLHGCVVLQDFQSEICDLTSAKFFFAELSSSIGTLISHNPNKQDYIWEIKPQISTSQIKTFSEDNHVAPLHTDSQYRACPEKYMALLVFHQATCGGGDTILLDFKKVLAELDNSIDGRKLIKFAKQEKFPIAIPSIFQTSPHQNYIYSSLISDTPLIRYRYDTLKAGISLVNHDRADELHEQLDCLNNHIQSSSHQCNFSLSDGEMIFVDNHRFLHGRSSFTDPNRLLLRSRFN
jgi:alpha-ketoglutarate-dependent taurine dioxygenase